MAEREQIRKPAPNERENETTDSPSASERGEELKVDLVEQVVETNAEDFVKSYIQKGGQ